MTKFSVFIAVAFLSIVPTVEFLRWCKPLKAGQMPPVSAEKLKLVSRVIHGELLAVIIILLCAAIMARRGWV